MTMSMSRSSSTTSSTRSLARSSSEGSWSVKSYSEGTPWTVSALLKHLPDDAFVSPAPGNYDADKLPPKHRAPAYSISRSPRTDMLTGNQQAPGPGAYRSEEAVDRLRMHTPVVAIPTARAEPVFATQSVAPGPGAYSPRKPLTKSPSATIPTASHDGPVRPSAFSQSSIAPGPGFYDVAAAERDLRPSTPGQTIGRASYSPSKQQQQDVVPGPGAYDVSHAKERHKFHATMSGTKVPKLQVQTSPGPGQYNADKQRRHSPTAVISPPSRYVHRNAGLSAEDILREMERARADRLIGLSRESSRISTSAGF
eukprot:TRINITY_DN4030_c0_g1_i1.p1 TRINITY_DN4030_c0_g1~~TRINITY_DN4030_c0_g1_i1.p1  ORF type:complete len:311 (-),score=43.16 TRINITY_DN4030_c0_g1_i1:286-1218(-)